MNVLAKGSRQPGGDVVEILRKVLIKLAHTR
jgi:hypothetical protein